MYIYVFCFKPADGPGDTLFLESMSLVPLIPGAVDVAYSPGVRGAVDDIIALIVNVKEEGQKQESGVSVAVDVNVQLAASSDTPSTSMDLAVVPDPSVQLEQMFAAAARKGPDAVRRFQEAFFGKYNRFLFMHIIEIHNSMPFF